MVDYSQAWEKYRRRRNRLMIVAVSIVPAWLLLLAVSSVAPNNEIFSVLLGLLVLGWFFGTIITSYQAQYCPCPRCGKQFSSKWWYHRSMAFARRCAHCGLAKYANSDISAKLTL
jgi:hypothetical protein